MTAVDGCQQPTTMLRDNATYYTKWLHACIKSFQLFHFTHWCKYLRLDVEFAQNTLYLHLTLWWRKCKLVRSAHLRVPSKRVAMVSRKVFCGASRPLITGILLRVDCDLLPPLRPAEAVDSWSAPNPGKNRDVPGAHPRPCRSAPIRDTCGSTLAAQQWPYPSTESPHICLTSCHKEGEIRVLVSVNQVLGDEMNLCVTAALETGGPTGEATAHWCRVNSSVPPRSFLSTSILLAFSSCYNQQLSRHVVSRVWWGG